MTEQQRLYSIWRQSLIEAARACSSVERADIPFDAYHASAQFLIEAIFATNCGLNGLNPPVASGPDLYPHGSEFDSRMRPLDAPLHAGSGHYDPLA